MDEIEIINLSRDIKILMLNILKEGTMVKTQADELVDFMVKSKLITQVSIVFKKYQNES